MSRLISRLRSKDGTFRVEITPDKTTVGDLKAFFEKETGIPAEMVTLSHAPPSVVGIPRGGPAKATILSSDSEIVSRIPGFENGYMFTVDYYKELQSVQEKELEEKRKQKESELDPNDISKMGLRYIKKNWTLNDYITEVNKKKIVIKTQKYPVCSLCAVDRKSAQSFQMYLSEMAFQRQRMGYLLGTTQPGVKPSSGDSTVDDDKTHSNVLDTTLHNFQHTQCAVIYEPPQHGDVEGFIELEDPKESTVDQLSALLGMKRVGWIFSHHGQNREKPLTASEILKMAEMQSKYGEAFVTVVVSPNEKMQAKFEAFQVSKQCVSLYEKGLLELDPKNNDIIRTKVPVECERKIVNELDTLVFIVNVPIQNTQSIFQVGFPPCNRDEEQSLSKLKETLLKRQHLPFLARITDFHLLLYLTEHLSLSSDFPALCEAIKTKNERKAENCKLLIEAYAGIL